jgi:aconitate hydratase
MAYDPFHARKTLTAGAAFFSLPELEKQGVGPVSRLPVSIRIVLESVLRNCDGVKVREDDVRQLANWKPRAQRSEEIPFTVSRILLQDFTGVPLLVDLAAMRSAVARMGRGAGMIEPLVPVDLVIDHSVQVDYAHTSDALRLNMELEFQRNRRRYEFLKWGMQSFHSFNVIPPGIGICHQVNLEYLAKVVHLKDGLCYPDTLVGTDSHTTMVNGLGVVGWGVGGIEAEAGMLGQPVYFLTPDVVGVELSGSLREGVTATDLVLHITEMLRRAKVVGKFVEFHGAGAASLAVPDRATVANMAPEYGATLGFFPVDDNTCRYLRATGRLEDNVRMVADYFRAQGMFGIPGAGQCEYSTLLRLNLSEVQPSVSGPKRPQDRIDLPRLKETFQSLLRKPIAEGGYGKSDAGGAERFPVDLPGGGLHQANGGGDQNPDSAPIGKGGVSVRNTSTWTEIEMMTNRPTAAAAQDLGQQDFSTPQVDLGHGDVVIAAITSCTNTSNPSVMLGAGLLARKAAARGLAARPSVKCSLAPGSRAVSDYLERTGLMEDLNRIGFNLVGYGCTTCIGNSGPLDPRIEHLITQHDLVVASVLSGNRNFEARVHQSVKANFLMSPPLVVAFALAGRIDIDLTREPLGRGSNGCEVYLREVWPEPREIRDLIHNAFDPGTYGRLYGTFADQNPLWDAIPAPTGEAYTWDPESTYVREPPYFEKFTMTPPGISEIRNARPLAIYGDSVTTDHISPAGAIKPASPAGEYLLEKGVGIPDFNSYGSRRGNHEVMVRGTFANVRIRNLMVPGVEGGVTVHYPAGERVSIYEASSRYQEAGIPLIILAGQEYGTGSSRDWAAKGTRLLGVRAVVAQSYERIHRSNLVGMGVLPCQFKEGMTVKTLGLNGSETYDLVGFAGGIRPGQDVTLVVRRAHGQTDEIGVTLRIDTPIEVDYYRHGGILPFVLRQLLG